MTMEISQDCFNTKSVDETIELGKQFGSAIADGEFIALYGDLGAGKTAFVKGIAESILPNAYVQSPTYKFLNIYSDNNKRICHFDMYRITNEDDLYSIGFFDFAPPDIIVVEWSENIEYALPETYYKVTIEKVDIDERLITIERISA